jgi:hypothetical protein
MKFLCLLAMAIILASAGTGWAAIYFNDFAATRQTWLGRSYYTSNSNYSTRRFGRVSNGTMDVSLMDFDRTGIFNWLQTLYTAGNGGPLNNIDQIGNGAVKMTLYVTAYDSWEETPTQPPTTFGHMFWPGVRLSTGQNWDETTATFNNAAVVNGTPSPWHDAAGNALANVFVNKYDTHANMIMNATSEQWGAADTLGGGADVYVYDTPRPWVLDQTVAWAALTNPDVVGFSLVHDYANKSWNQPGVDDQCPGSIYGRLHGLTEFRPYIEILIDTTKIGGPGHTYLPADFNHDLKVSFGDYLILEAHFGKSNVTNAQGDANNDGRVSFADYLVFEATFSPGPSHLPPDFNHDNYVNFADYLILERNFGHSGKTAYTGDADNDQWAKFNDYLILESYFGERLSGSGPTPEPACLAMLVGGALFIGRRRRR